MIPEINVRNPIHTQSTINSSTHFVASFTISMSTPHLRLTASQESPLESLSRVIFAILLSHLPANEIIVLSLTNRRLNDHIHSIQPPPTLPSIPQLPQHAGAPQAPQPTVDLEVPPQGISLHPLFQDIVYCTGDPYEDLYILTAVETVMIYIAGNAIMQQTAIYPPMRSIRLCVHGLLEVRVRARREFITIEEVIRTISEQNWAEIGERYEFGGLAHIGGRRFRVVRQSAP
jgi:hypothetical protein